MDADKLFHDFDADNSGTIDIDEFKNMLPFLGITVPDAKAQRLFKRFDGDDSGEISYDEWMVLAKNFEDGSFHSLLTPLDVFDLHDLERVGALDKAAFTNALRYQGFQYDDNRIDVLFDSGDPEHTGVLKYAGFRGIFLEICNPSKELQLRGLFVGKYDTPFELKEKLNVVLAEEEKQEAFAMKLAEERAEKEKKRRARLSRLRAEQDKYDELIEARKKRTEWRFREEEFSGTVELLRRQVVKLWDDKRYPHINQTNADGADALHLACRGGVQPIVQWLVQQEVYDFSDTDNLGRSALAHAVEGGQQHIIDWLVDKGASLTDVTDVELATLAHLAARAGQLEVLQDLYRDGLRLHVLDRDGRTCLHYAAVGGHLDIVQWLHSKERAVETRDNAGHTAMRLAIVADRLPVVQWLARHHKSYDPAVEDQICLWTEGDDRELLATCPRCRRHYTAHAPGQRHLISLRQALCYHCRNHEGKEAMNKRSDMVQSSMAAFGSAFGKGGAGPAEGPTTALAVVAAPDASGGGGGGGGGGDEASDGGQHSGKWHANPEVDCRYLPCSISTGLRAKLKGLPHWSCCLSTDRNGPCAKARARARRANTDTCNRPVTCQASILHGHLVAAEKQSEEAHEEMRAALLAGHPTRILKADEIVAAADQALKVARDALDRHTAD